MKKRLSCLLLLSMTMLLFTGCRIYGDYTMNADGTLTMKSKSAYSEAEVKALEMDTSKMTKEVLEDGKEYYVAPEEKKTLSAKVASEQNGFSITGDIFYYSFANTTANADMGEEDVYMKLAITLLGDIVDTNADVSKAGNKAEFSTNHPQTTWYAYTQKGKEQIAADVTAPKMLGAKQNKYYMIMPENVRFTDDVAVKEVFLNGKRVYASTLTEGEGDKTKVVGTVWSTAKGKTPSKNGKNVFKVSDLKGNTATYSFYIDEKPPVIKGIKNNKSYKNTVTFYVKDDVKLASVTIGGKKQKLSKKQLVKKGTYKGYYKYTVRKKGTTKVVVTDKAGNKNQVKIKIKK